MDSKLLLKTVRMALQKASGKPIDEAAQVVCDYISVAEGLLGDVPTPIRANEPVSTQTFPAAPRDLPPLPPVQDQPVVRNFRSPQELMVAIQNNMPPYLDVEVTREGKVLGIHMLRNVIASTAQDCYGASVSYMAEGQSPQNPYPKISFWVTDENLNFQGAIEDLKSQAIKIYSFVPKNIPTARPPAPSQIRFANPLEEA